MSNIDIVRIIISAHRGEQIPAETIAAICNELLVLRAWQKKALGALAKLLNKWRNANES